MNVNDIKFNDNNPRKISEEKFEKLVESIKNFPEMLKLRPIVINSWNVVIGGNMRLKACIEAGLTDVPVIIAHLTPDQEKEFIIKDNLNLGEWDYISLIEDWNLSSLKNWCIEIPESFKNIPKHQKEYTSKLEVVVEIDDKENQEQLLEEFKKRGLKCRKKTWLLASQ